jgi:hypothetical protein
LPSPELELSDWLPALPPYLPIPRWLARWMLEHAPIPPASASAPSGGLEVK